MRRHAMLVALGTLALWSAIITVATPFAGHDALTYLAAGERLNAGHPLYALSAGDRIVETQPPFYGPLLSPPLVAVAFRPLALLGIPGMWAATIAAGLVVAASVAYVVRRRPEASLFVLAAGLCFGMAAISGNVSNLFLPAYLALWRWRDRPVVGALVGVMGVAKLVPFAMVGFLVAGRRWRALAWCAAGAAAALAVTVAGAGWDNTIAYLGVARGAAPQPTSLAYLTGLAWLSPLTLAAGTAVAAMLPERWAYRLCILTIVFGAPVLSWREIATLVVL